MGTSVSPWMAGMTPVKGCALLAAALAAGGRSAVDEDGGGGGAGGSERGWGSGQGLTLVHSSAQLERLVWDKGCA